MEDWIWKGFLKQSVEHKVKSLCEWCSDLETEILERFKKGVVTKLITHLVTTPYLSNYFTQPFSKS